MRIFAIICAIVAMTGCGPRPGAEEPDPGPAPTGQQDTDAKPHVDVPPLSSYGWLDTANITIAPQAEQAAMQAKLQDYYSGLPMFLKVVSLYTRDRNVGLKDNPAYLTDIWVEYLSLVHQSEDDPPTAVADFDAAMVQWAIFRAWKKQNEFSSVDNYDDAVTGKTYTK